MIITVYAANGGEQGELAASLRRDPRVIGANECDFEDVDAVVVRIDEHYLEVVMWEYGMLWDADRQSFYRRLTEGWQ